MYRATAALYLRLVGLVYAIAFASLYAQLPGACSQSAASRHAESAEPLQARRAELYGIVQHTSSVAHLCALSTQ